MATKTKKEETPVINVPETINWYAVRVQNNKERSVLEKLQNEVKFSNLTDKFGRTIIPTEKTVAIKNGKKIFKEKIVYPGYIFIETSAKGEIASILKNINGAAGFVRTRSGDISPMKDYEVKKILVEQEITDNLDLSNIFTLNEMVEVIDGPFSSFKGKITKIEPDKEKVKIEISIFGRANEVDLTMAQIKKI
jgi:transcriptional antiterminator NusG